MKHPNGVGVRIETTQNTLLARRRTQFLLEASIVVKLELFSKHLNELLLKII